MCSGVEGEEPVAWNRLSVIVKPHGSVEEYEVVWDKWEPYVERGYS